MIRILLIAAVAGLSSPAHAEPTPSSQSLASFLAVMRALSERCAKHYTFDTARSLKHTQLSQQDGDKIYSKEYFSEVVAREAKKLDTAINNFGERAWCFETRGQLRDSAPDLFPADAPAR